MGRSKLRKLMLKKKLLEVTEDRGIPIPNLPEKFLWMHVKSGTKIRNVLGYALREFSNHECVVWTGTGQGLGKAISCAELFKRKHDGLHQITRLRYIESEKSNKEKEDGDDEGSNKPRRVPEIHILLSRNVKDTTQLGYQAPGNPGCFPNSKEISKSRSDTESERGGNGNVNCIDAEEFAAMGLRTGQKRPMKEQLGKAPRKKNKMEK